MLRTSGKISVRISPFFWVTAALIGWLNSMGSGSPFLLTFIWIFVIFISILVHEFGHALTARYFGLKPRIELVAFGGLTYQEGKRLKGWREFLVVLNGPIFGFLLFLLTAAIFQWGIFKGEVAQVTLRTFIWVNLFWTLLNLLPVMPLDGGQLLRVICESIFGAKGLKVAIFVSMMIAALFAALGFFVGFFLVGAIFFLFAFQNFMTWKNMRTITESDRDEDLVFELKKIEDLLAANQKQQAIPELEKIRHKAKKGLIFNLTSQYLAALKIEEGNFKEVYELLVPIQKHLSQESKIHLHQAAYEMKDYALVAELSGVCFQTIPDPTIALHSAEACAHLKQIEPTIGWLKAAHKYGEFDLKEIVKKEPYLELHDHPDFQPFMKTLD